MTFGNPGTVRFSCRKYSCHGHPASGTLNHPSCNAANRVNAGIHGLLLSISHPFVSIGRLKPHRRHLAGNSIHDSIVVLSMNRSRDVSMRQTYRYDFIITSMLFMQHFQDPPSPIPVSWFVET